MPVTLIDILKQKNGADFALLEDIDLLGGFQVVADLAGRDALPDSRRKEGMLVGQADSGMVWQLLGGISNGDWTEFEPGASISSWKQPVVIATVVDGTWTTTAELEFSGAQLTITGLDGGSFLGVIDGYELAEGDRILVKDAESASGGAAALAQYNGIWDVVAGGDPTSLVLERSGDSATAGDITSAVVRTARGSQVENTFSQIREISTVNSDDIAWVSASGGGLAIDIYADETALLLVTPLGDALAFAEAEATFWAYAASAGSPDWYRLSGSVTFVSYADEATLLADAPVQDTIGYAIAEETFHAYVFTQSAWKPMSAGSTAATTAFTPDGDIAATDVQAAIVEVRDDTDTKLGAKQNTSEKGVANGYASLDGTGKLPAAQLPISAMEYKGTWNANTNSPALADGVGDTGDVYRVSVAGSQDLGSGLIAFSIGDWVTYNGTIWEQSNHAGGGGGPGAVPSRDDIALTPAATVGDDQDTTLDITNTPASDGNVMVAVNGILYEVGDAVKTQDCYFSGDGGTNARAVADIIGGDSLYWNGLVAGFDLAATDRVDVIYNAV